jgi:hypothetical protein
MKSPIMKKLFLLLFTCPLFSNAQFLTNFIEPYKTPQSQFYLDTSIYPSTNFSAFDYSTNNSGDLILRSQYNFITSNSKLLSRQYTFTNPGEFDYYETNYEFKNGLPSQMRYFRRQKDQTTLEPNGTDSFIYDGQLIKYKIYLSGNQNPNTKKEYTYDSTYGIKATFMRELPGLIEYTAMFDVKAFHKAHLPAIVSTYSDSEFERKLYRTSYYSYDSLDRVTNAIDSVFLFGNMRLDGYRRIVYKSNSTKIDSIVENNILFNEERFYYLEYDSQEKLSQFSRYERKINDEFKLKQRIVYTKNPVGTSELNRSKFTFSLYPNPTSHIVYFQSNQKINHISLYDLQSNIVLEESADDLKILDISSLSPGVYLIGVECEGKKQFGRLLKSY